MSKSPFPFPKDTSKYFLSYLSGFMVFMAVLVCAGGIVAFNALAVWQRQTQTQLTIQIPTLDKQGQPRADAVQQDIDTIMLLLKDFPAVRKMTVMSDDEMKHLMQDWITVDVDMASLPLPKLLTVELDENEPLDKDKLALNMAEQVPLALLDTHQSWVQDLLDFTQHLIWVIEIVMAFIFLTLMCAVSYLTKNTLQLHHPILSLLHMLGATDNRIIFQYAFLHLKKAFYGACVGTVLAVAIGLMAAYYVQGKGIFSLHFTPEQIIIMTFIPLGVAVGTFLTSVLATRHYLRKFL